MMEMLQQQLQEIESRLNNEWVRTQSIRATEPGSARVRPEPAGIMTMRIMRIHVLLEMIRLGDHTRTETIRKDFSHIVEDAAWWMSQGKQDGTALSDAVDMILLAGPENRKLLLRQLDLMTRMKIKKPGPLKEEFFLAAESMADDCVEQGLAELSCGIWENLIALSGERNKAHPNQHRELTRRALAHLVDMDQERTRKICDAQKQYFVNTSDFNAACFFWFHGHGLAQGGLWQQARDAFLTSHKAFLEFGGPESWMAIRSGQAHHLCGLEQCWCEESEAYLWNFVELAESGRYEHDPMWQPELGPATRYELLRIRMDRQDLCGMLPHIEKNYAYCAAHQHQTRNPRLTVRTAENLWGGYHLCQGDLVQAAYHAMNALTAQTPPGLQKIPSDELMYSNLLHIYNLLNDQNRMYDLACMLSERLEEITDETLYYRLSVLIQTASRNLGFPLEEDAQEYRPELEKIHGWLMEGDTEVLDRGGVTCAMWVMTMVETVVDSGSVTEEECRSYMDIAAYFQRNPRHFPFQEIQRTVFQFLMARLAWYLKDWEETKRYLAGSLEGLEKRSVPREVQINTARAAAVMYYSMGQKTLAKNAVERSLGYISDGWKKTTAYLNDHTVVQILSRSSDSILFGYSILRQMVSDQALYDCLLRFKDLPALVGRERNRLLKLAPVDEILMGQIYQLQNRLAAAQISDSQLGTDHASEIARELQTLEAQFAEQFPENLTFTEVSFDHLGQTLQEGEAIVEYFFAFGQDGLTGGVVAAETAELDIFVVKKTGGAVTVRRLVKPRGDRILEAAMDYVKILEDHMKSRAKAKEKLLLRGELYRMLLEPVMPCLDGVRKLYLAPDMALCNVPFEILQADGSGVLSERFAVCRLTCGRELLFDSGDGLPNHRKFILGDPDYEAEQGQVQPSAERGGNQPLEPVPGLPFSGVEASRIGRRFRMEVCTGKMATKFALEQALPCGIIHLATHGAFDTEMETDALYSSYLIFAGYNRWVTNKTESTHCGNGVLTADEISRMDLRGTELVVLSACQSGMGSASDGTVQGLISAFSAAGVRWVVSHMWKANDFAAAVLMEAFYEGYLDRKLPVPEALDRAKEYLRDVTVGELRQKGWFRTDGLSEDSSRLLAQCAASPDRRRLFADEVYWGGFVAHRCK